MSVKDNAKKEEKLITMGIAKSVTNMHQEQEFGILIARRKRLRKNVVQRGIGDEL